MLHPVFHRALVGANFVVATLHQCFATSIHAFGNLVVFDTGLHVGGLLRFNKLAFECNDFLWVVKLHHIEGFVRVDGMQGRNRQHMRIPLDHDVRVISQPNRATVRQLTIAVFQQYVVPLLVSARAWFAKTR